MSDIYNQTAQILRLSHDEVTTETFNQSAKMSENIFLKREISQILTRQMDEVQVKNVT